MRWKNVFGVLLLMTFGFVLGATYDQFVGSPQADSRGRSRQSYTSRLEEELIRELQLDEQQKLVLQKSIEEAREKLHQLRHDYRPRVGEILQEARDSLVPHLTADQLRLREEMIRQKEEKHRQRGLNKESRQKRKSDD